MPATTRNTTNIVLPKQVSSEIWANTLESSAVMQLARRINLPGAGMEFQTITGEPTANWVAEGAKKPVSNASFGSKSMKGYTMAVILPFSNQFRRDKEALYEEIVRRAPYALGAKLDKTVFGNDTVPGELFDKLTGSTKVALDGSNGAWDALVTADTTIAAANGILDGFAISPAAKALLLTEKDSTGRPLFINDMRREGSVPEVMGQPTYVKKSIFNAATSTSPAIVGYAGDWSSALYGVVEDIKTSISDQATLTIDNELVSLWENNLFALRLEFEVGFRVKDGAHFVALTQGSATQG